jgi:RNA polymerase sigma-70 factor (sigma-E family)
MGSTEGVLVADGQAAAIAGARSRLEALYDAHARSALRLAYLLTGDRHLAEDLVQDAFVRVSGRFVDLRAPEAFGGYLRRTIINLSHGYFRRLKVERNYLQRERSRATRDEEMLPDIEGRDELVAALARLPARQRTAVALRYFEDLSEQQAADAMDCSVSAMKSLVNRATTTLREHLAETGVDR